MDLYRHPIRTGLVFVMILAFPVQAKADPQAGETGAKPKSMNQRLAERHRTLVVVDRQYKLGKENRVSTCKGRGSSIKVC